MEGSRRRRQLDEKRLSSPPVTVPVLVIAAVAIKPPPPFVQTVPRKARPLRPPAPSVGEQSRPPPPLPGSASQVAGFGAGEGKRRGGRGGGSSHSAALHLREHRGWGGEGPRLPPREDALAINPRLRRVRRRWTSRAERIQRPEGARGGGSPPGPAPSPALPCPTFPSALSGAAKRCESFPHLPGKPWRNRGSPSAKVAEGTGAERASPAALTSLGGEQGPDAASPHPTPAFLRGSGAFGGASCLRSGPALGRCGGGRGGS